MAAVHTRVFRERMGDRSIGLCRGPELHAPIAAARHREPDAGSAHLLTRTGTAPFHFRASLASAAADAKKDS